MKQTKSVVDTLKEQGKSLDYIEGFIDGNLKGLKEAKDIFRKGKK